MTAAEGAGTNLTTVTWKHAVNSAKLLEDALKSGKNPERSVVLVQTRL